ncbi:putative glycolipid-binding domain-containing protein [Pseudomonas sp. PDNC002]|uniref:putative glycolipid-binding domain-containing protein n=1 Tax=Pseudomonas sp. PDNC002 TaxID=2811422 RepID=UPI001964CB97|nr:putative glycolipid-binding domain-containing protein [Pseudomonas sp. PDNC002]QRY77594.1 putative glycolipid-binding domain-containing protein [Pseudomonas sp. PDNC002]
MRTLNWEGIWHAPTASWESLQLSDDRAESQLRAIDEAGGPSYQLEYQLNWDAGWRLREARFSVESARGTHQLHLLADGEGHWQTADGAALAELDGCLDIDIWPTPFTNTFPIRRLQLADGERRELTVVYLEAPKLKPVRMRQGYTRVDARHYHYENLEGTNFQALLTVDDEGLVIDYPTLFRRV